MKDNKLKERVSVDRMLKLLNLDNFNKYEEEYLMNE